MPLFRGEAPKIKSLCCFLWTDSIAVTSGMQWKTMKKQHLVTFFLFPMPWCQQSRVNMHETEEAYDEEERPDSEIDTPLIVRDVSWNDTVVKSSKLHSVQHVIGISKVSQWFQSFYCTITAPICTHGCPHQFMTIQLHIDNQIDFWGKVEYMNISLVR